jgi:iron complex outermembrane receptor protein
MPLSPEMAAPKDIGTVNATDAGGAAAQPRPGTAAWSAPSRAPLDAIQPTSVIGPRYIERNVMPMQNYDSIIKFAPSVQNVEPVGAGLQQNFFETIRGFNYKQFNTMFDGLVLPGTLSSFAPQSEAYFMAHDIGSVRVDRGPGSASTIGYATFGGTVDILSKEPLNNFTVNPYTTFGSFNTWLRGIELDTGVRPEAGGVRELIDLSAVDGDGYLTGTATKRRNGFTKIEVPVGDNTLITFVGMVNTSFNQTPIGATQAQIHTLGADYGLNNDPTSQAYKGYNVDHYSADFEYLRVKSDLGDGWGVEFTPYTASYYHRNIVGLDPNGTTPNLTGTYFVNGIATKLVNAVPGRASHGDFRDWGAVLRVTKDTNIGQARAGIWFDDNIGGSYRTDILLSQGNLPYTKTATATPFNYNYHTTLRTYQPYAEFALKPLPGLVITPGLKLTSTTRDLEATINQGTKVPAQFSQTWSDLQPSIDARYTFFPGLVAYAQIAKGFLAPPLGVLQTLSPQNLSPQQTWNYQSGVTWQTDRFTLSADVYHIDFSNRIASQVISGTTFYFNGGGAVYQGVEFEGTVLVGQGVSLYGNASVNDTYYRHTSTQLAGAPSRTAAAGVLYDKNELSAALLAKYVGTQWGQDSITTNGVTSLVDAYPIKSYTSVDFAMGYTLGILNGRKLDFRVNVNNIFNNHNIIGLDTLAGDGKTGLFWTNPGRSVFFTVSASL